MRASGGGGGENQSSGLRSHGVGVDADGFLGGGGPGEPSVRVTAVLDFGGKKEWAGERDGRAMKLEARIKDLAMKNMELEARIKVLEAETKRNEKEKRAIVKMQKQREQFRDKIFCFGALLYVGLFAILLAVIVSK
ncbi:hypothetical protein ACQJBY_017574 [Aegilops geniculata]